jgi:histidyl-tRNA synthetase
LFQQWVFELKELFKLLDLFWISKNVSFDPYIVRGLDYYTGLVFETFLEKDFWLGSIASWWRYENFTKFLSDKIILSGVGGSIWVSRLESYIFEKVSLSGKTSTEYLFINFSQTYDEIFKLYLDFLKEWKNCEIYPIPTKLKKQFKYADKKWIPYCVVLWEEELENNVYIIKDMKTGNEIKIRKKAG